MNPISKAYKDILGESDFVYLDIGARSGPPKKIQELFDDKILKLILVEFEKEEIERLKEQGYIVCEKPLWSEITHKDIYQTKNKSYSSLLKPDQKVISGSFYADRNFYEIEKTIQKKTTTLKELLSENKNKFKQLDFIKIDIQGAEGHIFQSFDSEIWDNLIGCKSETYTNKLYEDTQCLDILIPQFYNNHFEIYDLKKGSSMIRTSFMNEKIYSEDYFQARPNSRFYKGKDLVYDILFLKSIDITINKKNEKRVRKIIFILMLYGYYDFAFFTLLKSKQNKIFTEEDFLIIKKSMRQIIDIKLPLLWRLKEKFLIKLYNLI